MEINPQSSNTNISNYSKVQNKDILPKVYFQSSNDVVDLSTNKTENITPWYKKTSTIIIAGLAAVGAGYLILKGKGSKAEEIVDITIKNVETEIDELKPNTKEIVTKKTDEFASGIEHEVYLLDFQQKQKEQELLNHQKNHPGIHEIRDKINKFASEKVVNNPELKEYWNFFDKMQEVADTESSQLMEKSKHIYLKYVVGDLMLAKINPEKAEIIGNNFKNNFGFSLEQVTEMLNKSKNSSDEQIVRIFDPLINNIKEKEKQIRKECKQAKTQFEYENLFSINKSIDDILSTNRNEFIDSTYQFGSKRYKYLSFLPDNLKEIIENKDNASYFYKEDGFKRIINKCQKEKERLLKQNK